VPFADIWKKQSATKLKIGKINIEKWKNGARKIKKSRTRQMLGGMRSTPKGGLGNALP